MLKYVLSDHIILKLPTMQYYQMHNEKDLVAVGPLLFLRLSRSLVRLRLARAEMRWPPAEIIVQDGRMH